MPKLRPELTEDDLRSLASRAEARLYRALRDQLRAGDLVIHSAQWLYHARTGALVEGEADFTVFRPDGGFLTIEVKGGGIARDPISGKWSSIDRQGHRHIIKDPFRQAQSERFAILDQLKGYPDWHRWPGTRILCGHAVLLPDIEDPTPLLGPGRPREIVGVRRDLDRLEDWIADVMRFFDKYPTQPLGPVGMLLIEQIFCRSIEVRPALAAILAQEEEVRIRLTSQQGRILRIIGGRTRAVIAGGAGTGKTLIAVEKARRLADDGKRTLLLCYNRPLADAIRLAQHGVTGLDVMSYHQLCDQRIAAASHESGRNVLGEAKEAFPGESLFEIQMPLALGLANEILTDRYEAVIVDEAQDFSDEYWVGVENLLRDRKNGLLYLFIDPNQTVYRRRARLPIEDEPYYLTANCRNTSFIHEAAYRYYAGERTDPPELEGTPLEQLHAEQATKQAKLIAAELGRLTRSEGVQPSDIAVLVLGRPKDEYYRLLTALPVSAGLRWAVELHSPDVVLLDTVSRFKGLEAAVVILWLPPLIDGEGDRELLYVGLSRGKSRLYLVGTQSACAAVLTVT